MVRVLSGQIPQLLVAVQLLNKVHIAVAGTQSAARGDVGPDKIIQCLQVYFVLSQIHRQHTAADIHTNNIGTNLIAQCSSKANHAAAAHMDIRHDAHLRIRKGRLGQQIIDLIDRHGIHIFRINF